MRKEHVWLIGQAVASIGHFLLFADLGFLISSVVEGHHYPTDVYGYVLAAALLGIAMKFGGDAISEKSKRRK